MIEHIFNLAGVMCSIAFSTYVIILWMLIFFKRHSIAQKYRMSDDMVMETIMFILCLVMAGEGLFLTPMNDGEFIITGIVMMMCTALAVGSFIVVWLVKGVIFIRSKVPEE